MTDQRRYIPWVTIALAAANLIVFAIELAAGGDPLWGPTPDKMLALGGNYGPLTLDGEPWRLFTSMFLHYGLIHVGLNMFMGLYQVGRHVERMYGRAGYAAVYLFSGLAGSLASALRGSAISAGASGAIFGIIGAFAAYLLVHRNRLDQAALKKQAQSLVMLIAINVWLGFQAKGIDMAAHIGGLVTGFLGGLALQAGASAARQTALRAILVGVIGSGAIVGVAIALPAPKTTLWLPADKAAFDKFVDLEAAMVAGYNEIVNTAGISDEDAVALLDTKAIPAWRDAERYVDSIRRAPGGLGPALRPYWQARMTALTELRAALARHDRDGATAAGAKFNAALETLNKSLSP